MSKSNPLYPILGKEARELRMARVLAKRHEPTSEELKTARHMAQNGATIEEIRIALKWNMTEGGCCGRLKKYNIFSRRYNPSKYGKNTTIPNIKSGVSQNNYQPKKIVVDKGS